MIMTLAGLRAEPAPSIAIADKIFLDNYERSWKNIKINFFFFFVLRHVEHPGTEPFYTFRQAILHFSEMNVHLNNELINL